MFCKTQDGLHLYYEWQGLENTGETLVLLNGLTQSTLSWGLVIPYFKTTYRILLLDFVFQGQSDKTGHWRDFYQHADDVISVLDKEGITKAHILGLSYGSLVAQHLAVKHPGRLQKLMLVSTFAHKTPYYEAIELSWWRALEMGGYNLLLDIMLPSVLSEGYFSNPLIPIEAMKEMRRETNQNKEALLNLMRATKESGDFRPTLRRITAPTLIVQGEKDLLLPVHLANEVHLNIKGSRFIVIPNAGHTLNLEHVPDMCQLAAGFLAN